MSDTMLVAITKPVDYVIKTTIVLILVH